MFERMPDSIVQASTGGIAPGEPGLSSSSNIDFNQNEEGAHEGNLARGREQGGNQQEDHTQSREPGEQEQEHHHQERSKEEISCNNSMQTRMPLPIVEASQGGIGPIGNKLPSKINPINFKKLRQPTLKWPEESKGERKEAPRDIKEEAKKATITTQEGQMVEGCSEE